MAFEADLGVFYEASEHAEVWRYTSKLGGLPFDVPLLDASDDDPAQAGGRPVSRRIRILRAITSQLPELQKGDDLARDGVTFKVSSFTQINDGAEVRIILKRAEGE